MAVSPEFRPNGASLYSAKIEPRVESVRAPITAAPTASLGSFRAWRDRSDTNANSSLPYTFGVIAIVIVGFLGYAYLSPASNLDLATNQSSVMVRPVVVFTAAPAAPAAPGSSSAAIAAPLTLKK
jgi:hypothetical protein